MENSNVDNNLKGNKRKKKRSANQMAKKFARRRVPTSGELDAETYQYMLRIQEILTNFDKMDDKLIFVNNVFEQINGNEINCVKNQVGSKVLEKLMDYASFETIQKLVDALYPSLRPLCSDPFSSHVIEQIIHTCADKGNRNEIIVNADDAAKYNAIALKLSKYLINNIEDFIWDVYANHILRTVLRCLNGFFNQKTNKEAIKINKTDLRPVINQFAELFNNTVNNILKWPRFSEFGKDPLTSGFLQCLLSILKIKDCPSADVIIMKIVNECFIPNSNEKNLNIFNSEASLHLLESCLLAASPETYAFLYEKYFKENTKELVLEQKTCFSIQKLIENCPNTDLFESIFEEFPMYYPLIKNCSAVIVSLANTCLRLKTHQGHFYKRLNQGLGSDDPSRSQLIAQLLLRLISYDEYLEMIKNKRKIDFQLHGSLIFQAILKFNKPIKMVQALLSLTPQELCDLFSNPKGSHIVDAYMDSEYIGEKSRIELFKKMQGYWVQLAVGIHGSRCVDKFWQHSGDKQKIIIMNELSNAGESLKGSKSGKIIYKKLNISLYINNKKEWLESGNKNKTKQLFSDIIGNK